MSRVANHLVLLREPHSQVTESYRSLRTKLQLALARGVKSFCVVSTWGRDGKSTVALNIAHSLSQLYHHVALIDGDLRKPTLSRLFELQDHPGFADLLISGGEPEELLYRTPAERLWFMPAGKERENPTDLLGRGQLDKFFGQLHAAGHIAVIDTSPLNACSDALLLGPSVGSALFVVNASNWEGESELRIKEALEDYNFEVLGVVLNGAPESESDVGSGYGYGYGYGREEQKPKRAGFWKRLLRLGRE